MVATRHGVGPSAENADPEMFVQPGSTLSPYKVTAKIGEVGMDI